jgi:large subunit ribosomal protein L25
MSAAMHNVAANPRTTRGKGAARRLRNGGQIPAVAYGKGLAQAMPLSVTPKDIITVLKSERGQNTVLSMKVEGGTDLLVMIKSFTLHPVARTLEHVDFVEVKLDKQVDVEIPLIALGKPIGLANGGLVRQVYRTVPVRCLPDRIPLKIEVDISHLDIHESLPPQPRADGDRHRRAREGSRRGRGCGGGSGRSPGSGRSGGGGQAGSGRSGGRGGQGCREGSCQGRQEEEVSGPR